MALKRRSPNKARRVIIATEENFISVKQTFMGSGEYYVVVNSIVQAKLSFGKYYILRKDQAQKLAMIIFKKLI